VGRRWPLFVGDCDVSEKSVWAFRWEGQRLAS
jgi:hypothetical protein